MFAKSQESLPFIHTVFILINIAYFALFGILQDIFREIAAIFGKPKTPSTLNFLDAWFQRNVFIRGRDCFGRPVTSCPGAWISVKPVLNNRWTFKLTYLTFSLFFLSTVDEPKRMVNTGSYNYLGFAEPGKNKSVSDSIKTWGSSTCSPRLELGTTSVHCQLEDLLAEFLNMESCIVYGMGFATNSTTLPALLGGSNTLVISDSENHSSIVTGIRNSGSVVNVFEHNNTEQIEWFVRRGIIYGHPRTHRPYDKIVIIVEGIYSMEGDMTPLADIVKIKKKYNCYLYIDEAHSIGALGSTGRGICEYSGVDPSDVDILMGTFSKSFASIGGYCAGSKEIIDYLRICSHGSVSATSMSTPMVQQTLTVLEKIMGVNGETIGQERIKQLAQNTIYFRTQLKKMGLQVLGKDTSPVVPVLLYEPGRVTSFYRMAFARGLAAVIVGPPATTFFALRLRFCLSAGHTRKDINFILRVIHEICYIMSVVHCPLELEGPVPDRDYRR